MDIFDIALALTPQIGDATAEFLIEKLFTAKNIFALSADEIIQKTKINPDIAKNIALQTAIPAAEKELQYCQKNNIKIIAATDPEYPPLLREAPNHPHIIYVIGNIKTLTHNHIAFVGTRKITPYGQRVTTNIIEQIGQKLHNPVIVSGLAFGVDAAAHRAAIEFKIPTIAIIPTALPKITPASHSALARDIIDAGGAIISEMPSSARNNGRTFIARNRIIAATAATTVIVETPESGGSMQTAKIANSIGRPICAIPGRITDEMSKGCNKLISENIARPIFSADDIINHAALNDRRRYNTTQNDTIERGESIEMRDELHSLLSIFANNDPYHIDNLASLSGLPAATLTASLMELELLGAISSVSGSRYERIIKIDDARKV